MRTFTTLAILALTFLITEARLTSQGLDTAASVRSDLPDEAFLIQPEKGIAVNTPNFEARVADLTNFPALAGVDVQTQVIRVTLRSGRPFIPHYHPRGTETLNVIRGRLRVSFTFEGLNPRNVSNIIRAGESTVFPQGLPHTATCVSSRRDCMFVSNFNTADPGLVPVNL